MELEVRYKEGDSCYPMQLLAEKPYQNVTSHWTSVQQPQYLSSARKKFRVKELKL